MGKAFERKKSRISAILIGFGLFIGLLVLFVLVLWVNQRAAIQQVRHDFPAPGQLFSVQGNVIHLNCSGSSRLAHKAPTVVIDAGNASYSLDWSNLQRSLPSTYRVCTYDRPGYGWSKPSGNPRDADHIVEELHSLLQAAGEAGPYLLVGHSLGGLNMQLFAARYTDEVAGLILIEPPGANIQNEPYLQQMQVTIGIQQAMRFLTASGMMRVLGPLMDRQTLPAGAINLPAAEQEAYLQLLLDPQHYETALAENKNIFVSAEQVKAALPGEYPFGDMPLLVLTASMMDIPEGNNPFSTRRMPVDPEVITQQAALVSLSTRGKQRIVPDSGHLMQQDAPEVILTAINDLTQTFLESTVQGQ